MTNSEPLINSLQLRQRALSKRENEGDASQLPPCVEGGDRSDLTNTELVQLRIRVIALENLVIAVLADGSDRQRQIAIDMAGYISPRPDATQHPLTIQAADHMTDLVHRAVHFQTVQP